MVRRYLLGFPISRYSGVSRGRGKELISYYKTDFIVGPKDPEAIASYIKELSDKNKRELFGKRIRNIVKKEFDWDNIIKKYIEVYDSIK